MDCEGVVEVRDGRDVPRGASHRARKKGELIVDEVGDDLFHGLLG